MIQDTETTWDGTNIILHKDIQGIFIRLYVLNITSTLLSLVAIGCAALPSKYFLLLL